MRKSFKTVLLIAACVLYSLSASAKSNPENYAQWINYLAAPIWEVLKPDVVQQMLIPNGDESKPYVTVDGSQKSSWNDRIKQRNDWKQRNVFENINIDNILRLTNDENADHVFTVSDGNPGLDPTHPDTAYDPMNQRYVVVWEEETSPGHFDIQAQFRDRNGSPVGSPTTISSARTTQGCFYAAFDTDNGAISTPTNCPKASAPTVAYNNGRYLIAWELHGRADVAHNSDASNNDAGKNFSNIIAKVVNADNLTPASPAWAEGIMISRVWIASNVGTPVANDAQVQAWAQSTHPDVAPKLGADGFVVTWQSDKDFIGCVDPARRASSSIFARYIDQNFSPTGGAANKPIFAVYTDPSTVTATCPTLNNVMKASLPRISYNSTRSDFVVAFEYARASGATKGDIAAKKITLNNGNDATVTNSMAGDVVANAAEGTTYHNPDLAAYGQDTLLVYDDANNIFAKKLNVNTTSVTSSGDASSINLGAGGAKTEARIGANVGVGGVRNPTSAAPQRALLAYQQGGAMKWAVIDDSFMVLRGPGTASGMTSNNHLAEVASDLNNFLMVWAGTPNGTTIENVFGAAINSQDDLAAPVLTAPADNASLTQLSINLTWNAVAGSGIVYDVYLGVGGAAPMAVSTGQAATNFTVNPLTWGTTYQWRVVARDSLGRSGTSATRSFSTIAALQAPVLTAPANAGSVAMNSVNLTWNAVAGMGIVYDVFDGVAAVPGVPNATGIAATNYAVNGLTSQTSHQWKVRVRDMYGRSAESAVWTYNVGNLNMPTAPVLDAQPADNATWAPTRLYLSWAASTDADVGDTVTYDVYFEQVAGAMDPLPGGAVPYRTGVSDTHFVIQASTDNRAQYQPNGMHAGMQTFLAPNSHYAWKVCANDGRNNPAGVTCSPVRHFNTDNSVVGWWRFDENPVGPLCAGAAMGSGKTVCDYSGNNNHGVPNGGPAWLPPMAGILGGALQFDGVNASVLVDHSPTLAFAGGSSIGIETRLNSLSFVSDPNNPFIVTKGSNSSYHGNYSLIIKSSNNRPLFSYTSTTSVSILPTYFSNVPVPTGMWSHVITTYTFANPLSMKMNLNGSITGGTWSNADGSLTANGSENPLVENTALRFGQRSLFSQNHYNGTLDEVIIYNSYLSDQFLLNEFLTSN